MLRSIQYGLLILVFCGVSLTATAGPVVDGREWLIPKDIVVYTWNEYNAICPAGFCSGLLGGTGPDLTGWSWASIYEVGDLFNSLTPHPGGIASYSDNGT
jgi:hypothetical protein